MNTAAINKGDYLVASSDKKKPLLLKVSSVEDNIVSGSLCKDYHIKNLRQFVEIQVKDILVNLGTDPSPGIVYNNNVTDIYRGCKEHEEFGPLYWFYKADKQVIKDVMKGFDRTYKTLSKVGLEFLAHEPDTIWEIQKYHNEKYAGRYCHNPKEGGISKLQIKPEIIPATEYVYVIVHELAHRLHYKYVKSKKINASWIKLYNTSIKVTNINKSESEQLLEALLGGEMRPSDFKGQLEEDQALSFKWITRYINSNHGISIKELDYLFDADERDEIRLLWPTRSIPKKDLAPIISEYATKNYKETLAESLAYYLTGKKLPKPIVKLIERTISYAKSSAKSDSKS